MIDRFILLAMTPVTLATGAYGLASSAVAETSNLPFETLPAADGGDANDGAATAGAATDGRLILSGTDGLFRVNVRIYGKPVEMVVDTGATVTVLTAEDAARLGIDVNHGTGGTLRTAGGPMRYRRVTVPEVAIGNRTVRNIRVAVLDGSMDQSLLGQDIIGQLGSVTIDAGQLSLN